MYVLQEYTIEQKRNVFFKFADCFLDHSYAQELKAMVCNQFIISDQINLGLEIKPTREIVHFW